MFAYNALANGLLTGKFDRSVRFPEGDRRSRLPMFSGSAFNQALENVATISKAASEVGLTCAQYAIAKVAARPEVVSVVIGVKNRRQAEENCTVLRLTDFPRVETFPQRMM